MHTAAKVGLALVGLVALAAAINAIGHSYCTSRDPVRQFLWDAARRGDATKVHRTLQAYGLRVNSPHHVSRTHLVLDIARVSTSSEEIDRRLRNVLLLLEKAGWDLAIQDDYTLKNALHILLDHVSSCKIEHRLKLLVDRQMERPTHDNMLAAEDRDGKLPEHCVCGTRSKQLRPRLRSMRKEIEWALIATEASSVRMAAGGEGALMLRRWGDPDVEELENDE